MSPNLKAALAVFIAAAPSVEAQTVDLIEGELVSHLYYGRKV